jgi:hypothetical protein
LKDVGDSIGVVPEGNTFVCLDPERASLLIRSGLAKAEPPPEDKAIAPDLRGTVFILASGPSLTQAQCDAVRGKGKTIAINTTFALAPWADVLYACDGRWWDEYIERVREECTGEFWTQDVNAAKKYGLKLIASASSPGLGKGKFIHQGANGGYQAVNLAYLGGAKTIILLGFDMKATGGKKHHHGDHPSPMNTTLPYARWCAAFEQMAKDLKAEGVSVVNATPNSALKWFPKAALNELL